MPRWRPHSGGCGAACLNPLVLRDCLDTIRRTQRVLEALTEQLRWDGETLCVTLRRVDCK